MSYNEYPLEVLVRDNRIYLFNTKINPYIEINLRLIKENDSEENLYGTSGFVNFNNYRYSFREPFFSNFSLDNLLKNPSIVLNKIFGVTNYLITGLKDKLKFNISNNNLNNINNIVIKYFKKNIKNKENNKDYVAIYSDTTTYFSYCCANCAGTNTWVFSEASSDTSLNDACTLCSNQLRNNCGFMYGIKDITSLQCNSSYNELSCPLPSP